MDEAITASEHRRLRRIADFQFGAGAGEALFPDREELRAKRTSSGRPEQIHVPAGRLVTQNTDGRFTISVRAGRRLAAAFEPPTLRVEVGDESEPYVRDGKNAFAKFVRTADEGIRPGDEVLVTHDGSLLGVGRAELSGRAMYDFGTGMAVKIRSGIDD